MISRSLSTEHGFILGVCVARYDHTYQQGLDRMWSRKSRFDFYWPVFANIGEQAVLNKEIYAQGNATMMKSLAIRKLGLSIGIVLLVLLVRCVASMLSHWIPGTLRMIILLCRLFLMSGSERILPTWIVSWLFSPV